MTRYAPTGPSPDSECSRRSKNSCRSRNVPLGATVFGSLTTTLSCGKQRCNRLACIQAIGRRQDGTFFCNKYKNARFGDNRALFLAQACFERALRPAQLAEVSSQNNFRAALRSLRFINRGGRPKRGGKPKIRA